NVISADLHTDESTPHMQITVVPIRDGKLDAKSWLDGAARCAAFRKRLHSVVAKRIACEYTPGGPGGAPHDPRKAAGGPDAPKPSRGLLRAAIDAVDVVREVSAMRREIKALKASIQSLHTRARQQERAAERDRVERQEAERRARKAESVERDLRARIAQLEADLAKRDPGRRPAPAAGAHPRKG
ncbi:plasmid recombination protein, partial [Noviherbaspirillum aerium]|uniref:plasmid recombination protein n=1 Tax=Noviherbaspirillum aerium TaxID=2588497 RepID=UPI00178C43BD